MFLYRHLSGLLIVIVYFLFLQPAEAQTQGWSEPQVFYSTGPSGIGYLSPLVLGPDNSLHFAWINNPSNRTSTCVDTLIYMTIKNLRRNTPLFKITADTTTELKSPLIIVDDDSIAHLFWIEQKLILEDSTYHYKLIHRSTPLYGGEPSYQGPFLTDVLWSRGDLGAIGFPSATLTKYNMLYIAWDASYLETIWITGKSRGNFAWTAPVICPFSNFTITTGGCACWPNLFVGSHDTLYMVFIGDKTGELPLYGYRNFVHYSQKPLNSNRWIEPAFVWGNVTSASQQPRIVVDHYYKRHILWFELCDPRTSLFISNLFYSYSNDGQNWSAPKDLAITPAFFGSHEMVVDSHGTVHVFWIQYRNVSGKPAGVYYISGGGDVWSEPQLIFESTDEKGFDQIRVAIDLQNRLHVIESTGLGPPGGIYHRQIEYTWKDLYPTHVTDESRREKRLLQDFVVVKNYPHPFNAITTISVLPQEQCFVSLRIFNINGQCVRTLLTETLLNEEIKLQWEGSNDQGVALPSGVYCILLKIHPLLRHQTFNISGKILLLK